MHSFGLNYRGQAVVWLALATASVVTAQSPGIGGFVSTRVFDKLTGSIRPMLGMGGAAYLGAEVVGDLGHAAVSPDASMAFVVSKSEAFMVWDLRSSAIERNAIELDGGPWSIEGELSTRWASDSTLMILDASAKRLYRLSLDRGNRGVEVSRFDVRSLAGKLTLLAVHSSGAALLATESEAGEAGVYLWRDSSSFLLAPLRRASAGVFSIDGKTVFAADRDTRTVWKIDGLDITPTAQPVLEEQDGIVDPSGLALLEDGAVILVGNGSGRQVMSFKIATRERMLVLDVDAVPNSFEAFSNSLLLLNSQRSEYDPFIFVDLKPSVPATFFVPAKVDR